MSKNFKIQIVLQDLTGEEWFRIMDLLADFELKRREKNDNRRKGKKTEGT